MQRMGRPVSTFRIVVRRWVWAGERDLRWEEERTLQEDLERCYKEAKGNEAVRVSLA